MKVLTMTALAVATLVSSSAMANVVTNTAGTLVDGTRTVFSTMTRPAAVSAEIGTLGYGANIAWSVNDTTELQAGWAGGDIAGAVKNELKIDGTTYKIDSKFSNPYLGVQMRPAANWFTVGAGVIVPDNDISVRTVQGPNEKYSVNGTTFTVQQGSVVEGRLDYRNKLAPYMTVGFRPNLNNHWGVFGELGATYLGRADVDINVISSKEIPKVDNRDFTEEAKKSIEDKKYSNWYPIVKLGATYRF